MIHQGGYESIIAHKERFSFVLKANADQGNKKLMIQVLQWISSGS
jgi:hypothetical protein